MPSPNNALCHRIQNYLMPKGLRGAVVYAVAFGLLLPALITFALEQTFSIQVAKRELDRDLQRTTQTLALVMQSQLWELATENANSIIQAISNDPRFDSVVVYDIHSSTPFVEVHRPNDQNSQKSSLEYPIQRDGGTIGRIIVTMRLEPYLEATHQAQRWMMLRTALMLGVALVLIFLVLRKRLLAPIATLTEGANHLAQEDFDHEILLEYYDELGQVAGAMEQMRKTLLKTFAELRNKNEELTQHAALLEQHVAERTEALTRANAELTEAMEVLKNTQSGLMESEKLASLGRLVAGVAHELNTPLGNAMTVVSTLEEHFSELVTALESKTLRRSELMALIDNTREGQALLSRNIQRAADLIRDFKQLAIDQTTDMRRVFDLAKVIHEVLITIQPSFKGTPYKVNTALAIDIQMDSFPGPLGQVVTNLLLNALIHGFEGRDSGVVMLETHLMDADQIKIVCTDNGIGMDTDVKNRIFEPFFTTKLGRGGSGLGLHIVHNIVAGLLGGRIEVFSVPGQGSRFEITLPRSAPRTL